MSNNIQFRDLDIQNKEKPWWVDCLKTGNIHSCNNEDVDFYLKNDSFYNPQKEENEMNHSLNKNLHPRYYRNEYSQF